MILAIAGITVLTLGIGGFSAFAATGAGEDPAALAVRQEALAQYTEPTLHDALVEMASEVGINIADMTDEQIAEALKAEKAKYEDASGDLPSEELLIKAKELGIDVIGKEYPEINREVALKLNPDNGENLPGAKETSAVSYADALKLRKEALANYTEPTEHEALVEMAYEAGIDISGMTDDQMKDALKAAKTPN